MWIHLWKSWGIPVPYSNPQRVKTSFFTCPWLLPIKDETEIPLGSYSLKLWLNTPWGSRSDDFRELSALPSPYSTMTLIVIVCNCCSLVYLKYRGWTEERSLKQSSFWPKHSAWCRDWTDRQTKGTSSKAFPSQVHSHAAGSLKWRLCNISEFAFWSQL